MISTSDSDTAYLSLIPYDQDPLAFLAEKILAQQSPPDLSQVVVLMPELLAAAPLRERLKTRAQQRGHGHITLPQMDTLRAWIEKTTPLDHIVLGAHAQQLMLVESLMQHPGLLGEDNPWQLADNLIQLFEQLTARQVSLPEQLAQFTQQLARAYGVTKPELSGLGREAKMVHTLWQAWLAQCRSEGCIDAHRAYLQRLSASLARG